MKHLVLSILALSTLAACAPRQTESSGSSGSSSYGSRQRTYNPQTKEWEWEQPGPSTGPGAQTGPYYR